MLTARLEQQPGEVGGHRPTRDDGELVRGGHHGPFDAGGSRSTGAIDDHTCMENFTPSTPALCSADVDALSCYGDELAVVTVERRGARIVGPDGAETELRLAEEPGRPAVVNRAVAGLPGTSGGSPSSTPGVACTPGALERLRAAATPRAGAARPAPARPHPAPDPLLRPPPVAGTAAARPGARPARRRRPDRLARRPLRADPPPRLGLRRRLRLPLRRRPAPTPSPPTSTSATGWSGRVGSSSGCPRRRWSFTRSSGQGILDVRGQESRGRGLRRYVHDRYRAPARTLMALARRG